MGVFHSPGTTQYGSNDLSSPLGYICLSKTNKTHSEIWDLDLILLVVLCTFVPGKGTG